MITDKKIYLSKDHLFYWIELFGHVNKFAFGGWKEKRRRIRTTGKKKNLGYENLNLMNTEEFIKFLSCPAPALDSCFRKVKIRNVTLA